MSKPIYFIADLHLSEAQPELTALFLDFMQGRALQAQAVYILGDLFDFWVGDDEESALISAVKQALRGAADKGVKCYFIHGNRDFLIGKRFACDSGVVLLPEYQVIDLFGQKALICHGDTLCIDDTRYQAFRRKVQQKWRQKLFLLLPLGVRVKIAHKIRNISSRGKQTMAAQIMDVNPQFTAETVKRFGVPLLIHGHTHRENIHHEPEFTRIVLGDWRPDRVSVLRFDENGFGFER
ncbi:UDP-2,3-diacylglucosamine diphosphatase [Neisseria perflava]|uniref:UDP-2,3-diacylglucosamine diphosphatase n=1 Tax=Neisseria perflava TaxID=33053 RepID=UPI0020A01AC8|nr:UDP-2,3-diacylglucosamine diphosphatase [Neisseria perflava]MCP1659760.1 UDP-2,3-diacylglucosamine hydrolase [Neisseria perflava]MCP1771641.1 UDP-2,3-diacylglucosamine hydrolase [Neisseria perflava]